MSTENQTPKENEVVIEPTSTPEEKALLEEREAQIKELNDKLSNITDEVINSRKEKRELKEKLEELEQKVEAPVVTTPTEEPTNEQIIEQTVKKVLANETLSRARSNRQKALEEYIASNKEFHPDNDLTGLKREALEDKLKQFNTEGLVSVEQFKAVIGDAGKLLGVNDTTPYTPEPNNGSSSPVPTQEPNTINNNVTISKQEQDVIKAIGWTNERFLALKVKDPEYVKTMMKATEV